MIQNLRYLLFNKNRRENFRTLIIVLLFLLSSGLSYGQLGFVKNPEPDTTIRQYFRFDTIIGNAQPGDTVIGDGLTAEMYDEILITVNVPRIGSYEMPAIIHNEIAYLPVKELFDFLKIRNIASPDLDSLEVFFISPKLTYLIDKSLNQISTRDKVFKLNPADIIRTETGLYLKSDYFGHVFGLVCTFNFRSLSITLTTKIELPAIREMQQELIRKNINQLKGEKKADTTIKRGFSWFRLGMADWAVISSQETKSVSNTRVNLGVGAIVAGGEANLFLNYNSGQAFSMADQNYYWRHVNNDRAGLRQITAGKIFTQSTSSIFEQVTGVQFTNTPTTYRRSFGTYTLSDKTEPEWTVELYINNVLVNYTKADASGFFTFEVPMVYGNSIVKLRFFGPWGEERVREQNVTVPFNFIPARQFEYTLTAGIVNDDEKSKYSRVNLNYGLSKRMTIGGGMEYLSSVTSGKSMPFINASLRLGSNTMISGEHTYGVRSKGIINFRLPSDLQFNLSYLKYQKGQTAIWVNQLDEKKAVISMPIRGKKISAFSRLTISEITYSKANKFTNAELMLSAIFSNISANVTTTAVKSTANNPFVHSNLSLTFRLPAGIRFTPQAQYDFTGKSVNMIRGDLEKNIFKEGFLSVSYERYKNKENSIGIGFRYNFSFAQTAFFARRNKQSTITSQSARGSLLYNGKTSYLGSSNQNSVGRGGLIVIPFLDINCNQRRDPNEPRVEGLQLRINGGRIEHNYTDTTIRIVGLEGYTNYFIELDKNSFDNIGWQVQKSTMKVAIEPNTFKTIEVAIAVLGEVSGTVYLKESKGMDGLGRIIVNIYNSDSIIVARTLSEADGYFSYMGLAPGSYTIGVNPEQLLKLQMECSPVLPFKIQPSMDGDVVDGLQFVLNKKETK